MIVAILTWCGDLDALYGSLLTLKTLRVGFPDADVLVVDNGSLPKAREAIRREAAKVGAQFFAEEARPHHEFIRRCLETIRKPLVFADPDLIFWDRMEMSQEFSGRLIPRFFDPYTQCTTVARLHTSMWMVPEPQWLYSHMREIEGRRFEADLLRPVMLPTDNGWLRYDTGAALTQTVGKPFTEDQLDRYDHLFCGSHLKLVAPLLPTEARDAFEQSHALAASGDIEPLRGLWKRQEEFFKE